MLPPADIRSAANRRIPAMDIMNRLTSALALLAFCVVVPAQTGKDQAAANAEYDKLVAAWKAEVKANRDAVKAAQETPEFKAAREAKDNDKLRELMGAIKRPDAKSHGERALKLADRFGADGLRFLTFAAGNFSDKDVAKGILERVSAQHLKSPGIAEMLEKPMGMLGLVGPDAANELLTELASKNPHDEVKAWAMYWQSVMLTRGKPSDEQKAKAAELMAAAGKLATGELADRLAGPNFEKERLQIDMKAPDIAGEDMDGVSFKLSDYRGKVVVLDFWGFW